MAEYYRPTTVGEKIRKIIQIHWLWDRAAQQKQKLSYRNARISVLMVVPQIDRIGGYERQALQLANYLTHENNLVTLVSDRTENHSFKEFRNGFLIYRLPKHFRKSKFSLLISLLAFYFQRRARYQIVHIHGVTGFSLFALWIAKRMGLPAIIKPATKDDLHQLFSSKSLKHQIYASWILKADQLISVSRELEQEILSCGIPDSHIANIPNFVDSQKFSPATSEKRKLLRQRFSASDNQIVFLYVGRLEKRKGVDILLEAWKEMRNGILWIVGEGPEEKRLHSIGSNMERVTFFGAKEDVLDFYQAADVFVFPSVKEGFPNVLLEAMSCGLPCIASDIGGANELIADDREGLIVSKGSSESLARALSRAAESKEGRIRWGQEALKKVRENYDIVKMGQRYLALYSQVYSRR